MTLIYKYDSYKDLDKVLSKTISKVEKLSLYSNPKLIIKKVNNKWNLIITLTEVPKIKFK